MLRWRAAIGDRARDQEHGPDHDEDEDLFSPEDRIREHVARDHVDDVDRRCNEEQCANKNMRHSDEDDFFDALALEMPDCSSLMFLSLQIRNRTPMHLKPTRLTDGEASPGH